MPEQRKENITILVLGSLNIDFTFSVDHIVYPGETIGSTALQKSTGGKGANQAASLAKAGLPVHIAGKIGKDGEFLLPLLQSYGVNTDNIIIYEGATGQAIIQLDKKKQNAIVLYPGGNGSITKEEITTVINKYHKGDLLVLQNEISHLKEVIEAGSSRGLKICLNPSPYTKTIEELPLHLIDIFFVNEIEGAAIAAMPVDAPPRDVLDKLVRRFPSAEIILTAGKDGAYYGYKEIREKGEIIDLPVVDTTGAGDTFTGYFLAARYRGYTVKKALDLACRASSIAISRKGAMESIPFAKEVFSSLKTADDK